MADEGETVIGQHASALTRLAAGALFCVAAVALVWWVERGGPAPAPPPPATAAPQRSLRLAVESTYPVASWKVTVLGVAQNAAASDAWSWSGTVSAPSGEEVVVVATAAADVAAPHRGLRLRLGDAPERVVWGAGDVVATGTAP